MQFGNMTDDDRHAPTKSPAEISATELTVTFAKAFWRRPWQDLALRGRDDFHAPPKVQCRRDLDDALVRPSADLSHFL